MIVELKPETELLVQEEIKSGHVRSVDELIVHGVNALREKSRVAPPRKPRKHPSGFLSESPFAGSELDLERKDRRSDPASNGFFKNLAIEELATAQNVMPLQTGAELATSIGDESEDIDLMLDTIYRARK